MAQTGHAPTYGPANRLYLLGLTLCPECRSQLEGDDSSGWECSSCGETYPIAGGGR